jgi:hypothetical protein
MINQRPWSKLQGDSCVVTWIHSWWSINHKPTYVKEGRLSRARAKPWGTAHMYLRGQRRNGHYLSQDTSNWMWMETTFKQREHGTGMVLCDHNNDVILPCATNCSTALSPGSGASSMWWRNKARTELVVQAYWPGNRLLWGDTNDWNERLALF